MTAAPRPRPRPRARPRLAPATRARFTDVPVKGVRKMIADRMLASLATTAQLTLNASAPARALLDLGAGSRRAPRRWACAGITINDLVHFAVARTLLANRELNATFDGDTIRQYDDVHLAFATDTPRGLMVPVIRNAHALTLRHLAAEAARLAKALPGGRREARRALGRHVHVTNLGGLRHRELHARAERRRRWPSSGCAPSGPSRCRTATRAWFQPRIGLSLTINHQVVDGAPGARFLQALGAAFAALPALLAE